MKISKDELAIQDRDSGRIIKWFIDYTGENIWRNKINVLERTTGRGGFHFVADYISSKNQLINPIKKYFDLDDRGRTIWKHLDDELKWLVSKVHAINVISRNLTERAKEKMKSLLIADEVNSFLYEIEVAVHYMLNNFEVKFPDLESEDEQTRTFDLLIKKNSFIGEIECKGIGYDTGKRITKLGFYHFLDELAPVITTISSSYLIKIFCDNRLEKNKQKLRNLALQIKDKILQGIYDYRIDDKDIRITGLPELNNNTYINIIDGIMSANLNLMAHGACIKNENVAFIITVESRRENGVVQKIYDTLKKAAYQLSTNNPSIIACYIDGVKKNDWEILRQDSDLANMTNSFLRRDKSRHLNFVIYSCAPIMQKVGNVYQLKSPTLRFKNHKCKYDEFDKYFELSKNLEEKLFN